MGKKRSADHGLAEENYAALNQQFYGAAPHEYLDQRLDLLRWSLDRGDHTDQTLHESTADAARRNGADSRDRFCILESEALLHHAAETLLRLYLVHETRPPCPWLAISRERTPGRFQESVERRFLKTTLPSTERCQRVARVFFGGDPAEASPPIAEWERLALTLERFLAVFATRFLDSAPYNAVKHGLVITPGEPYLSIGASGEGQRVMLEGPGLSFLEERDRAGGTRCWHEVTNWIDVEYNLGLSRLATRMIKALWSVGASYYVHSPDAEIDSFAGVDFERTIHELRGPNRSPRARFAMKLAYDGGPCKTDAD